MGQMTHAVSTHPWHASDTRRNIAVSIRSLTQDGTAGNAQSVFGKGPIRDLREAAMRTVLTFTVLGLITGFLLAVGAMSSPLLRKVVTSDFSKGWWIALIAGLVASILTGGSLVQDQVGPSPSPSNTSKGFRVTA